MQKMETATPTAAATLGAAEGRKSFAERRLLVGQMPCLEQLRIEVRGYVYSPCSKNDEEHRAYDERAAQLRANIERLSSLRMRPLAETLSLIESSEFARYFEKIRKANPRIAEACKEGMRIGTPNIIFRLTNVDGVGLLKSDLEPSNHAITEAETEKIAQLLLASGHVKAWMVWALQSRGMGIPSWAGNPHGYVNAIGIIASFCWPAKQ